MEYKHRLSELDTYLFAKGTHYEIYEKMGAHLAEENGEKGTYFAVWAPNARSVGVVGDFNEWNAEANKDAAGSAVRYMGFIYPRCQKGRSL